MGASAVASTSHGPGHEDPQPAIIERYTKGGRKLYYKLTVIQQPERARACGSGPKSSADRRPVDPPPVVELRIFEGQNWQDAQSKDVTFLYNANFFLYATLEHARVIAHGRVQTPAANQPPILTGMPVSGMAYLDRPLEAGYFLFPDLSVRHEGRYRLTFNLYEETKEDKDKDPDAPDSKFTSPGFSSATGGSFDFRMEVKSCDFVVYSAKKFPGLSESTQLSRVVAEQGCRVRIRRDVRMRRRDRKAGDDYNNAEDEYARRRRTETPEARDYRARSMSGSVERTPFASDSSRRPSAVDYPPPPHFAAQPPSSLGHLQFLGSHPQYPPQSQPYQQPPSTPPSPSYQTAQGAVSYPPPPHPAVYSAPPQPQVYPAPPEPQPSPQHYAPINPSPQREAHFKRPSDDFTRPQPPPLRPLHPDYSDFSPIAPAAPGSKVVLPPIDVPRTPAPLPPSAVAAATAASRGMASLAPLVAPTVAGSKRSRDESFRYSDAPRYHNGARENPLEAEVDEGPLIYVRADGSKIVSHHVG